MFICGVKLSHVHVCFWKEIAQLLLMVIQILISQVADVDAFRSILSKLMSGCSPYSQSRVCTYVTRMTDSINLCRLYRFNISLYKPVIIATLPLVLLDLL